MKKLHFQFQTSAPSLTKKGSSLVEALLAIALFSLLATGIVGAIIFGRESSQIAARSQQALTLANEGLEAVRSIRDGDFANLSAGTYGLAVAGNLWSLSGSSDTIGEFTRAVTITSIDTDRFDIESEVTWQQNGQRNGAINLYSRLTNWAAIVVQEADLIVSTANATIGGGGDKELQGITIENSGASDIVIDKITVTWDNPQLIEQIKIDNTNVWRHNNEGTPDGKQSSGTELDIEDFTLVAGGGVLDISNFKFDGDMSGSIFTILFTLDDATTKEVTVDLSGGGGGSCGIESSYLVIDTTSTSIAGGGNKELRGLTVENTDAACDITITKITTTWTNGQLIEEIQVNGGRIWKHNNEGSPAGRQATGTEIDVIDHLIAASSTNSFDKLKFDGDMTGDTFTILFEMSDGSTLSTGSFSP